MIQVASHLSKMTTKSNQQLPPARKTLFRQSAVKEDFTDGPKVATKTNQIGSMRQPINNNKQPINSKERYPPKQTFLNPTRKNKSVSHPIQVLKQLHTRYNETLTYYEQDLFDRRKGETIRYDQDTRSKESVFQKQAFKKPLGRRDISDGLPVSSEALLANFRREKFASAHRKDSSDVLPSKQEALHQSHQSTNCLLVSKEIGNPSKKSGRSSELGYLNDEGFENGNSRRHSSSHCVPVFDIQEKAVLDSSQNIPKIELNGEERNSVSESGRQKGEVFRQSKKSSGYGTGESEETDPLPDEEYSSNVFLSAESSGERGANLPQAVHIHHEDLELLHLPAGKDILSHTGSAYSHTGERVVECKNSSLPPSALIWKFDRSINIKIPSNIEHKLEYIDNNTYSENNRLFMEIVKANPHITFNSLKEEDENRRQMLNNLEHVEKEIAATLSSQSWAQTSQSNEDDDDCALLFSEHSVPSASGIDDGEIISDEVDGKRCATANGYGPNNMANGYASGFSKCGDEMNAGSQRCGQENPSGAIAKNPSGHRLRAKGITDRDTRCEVLDGGRDTGDMAMTPSRQPLRPIGKDVAISRHSDNSHDNDCPHEACSCDKKLLHTHLERAIFCKNRSCDEGFSCCKVKRRVLDLQNLFQKNKLKDGRIILECLWHHSQKCDEMECTMPFCDVFHKRPHLSFEEHFSVMSSGSMNKRLQMELADTMQKQAHSGNFLTLNDAVSYVSWKTARILEGQFLGDFGDFNILHGRVSFRDNSLLDVVIKKAVSYKDARKVYFQIGQMCSPLFVKNYWCSTISEDILLICSAFYPDLISLHRLTSDLYLTLLQVVLAAQYLHSLTPNIVYLNWKCSNVLWDERSMNIKLCNFSKAIQLKRGHVVTCPANIVNSFDPRFTAPEVLRGEALGFYSDIWGIGCLFYEMITKSPPYPDHSHKSPAAIRKMVCSGPIQHTFLTDLSFLDILSHCWEEKRCRWRTEDLRDKLKGLLPKGSEAER